MVEPLGPTRFRVRPLEGRGEFKVSIDPVRECTCRESDVCVHILYIMIRVFRVPKEAEILWQRALTEHEVESLQSGSIGRDPAARQRVKRTEVRRGPARPRRQPVGPEDVCPICFDSLDNPAKVCSCRASWGSNFHRACVREWVNAKRAQGDPPTCPDGRGPLDLMCPMPKRAMPSASDQAIVRPQVGRTADRRRTARGTGQPWEFRWVAWNCASLDRLYCRMVPGTAPHPGVSTRGKSRMRRGGLAWPTSRGPRGVR
jgi:hypothetical protein